MSTDIEQVMQKELEELIGQHREFGPTQFIDDDKLVTLVVQGGDPKVVSTEIPTNTQLPIPHLSDLHVTPTYRIYNILQTLQLIDAERDLSAAADIMTQYTPDGVDGVVIEPPGSPPLPEIIHSSVTGQPDLRNRADDKGMYQTLENMQKHRAKLLAEHANLGPLTVSTAKENVSLRVVNGALIVEPSKEKGTPHMLVQREIQVQIYALQKSIATLERKLYGSVPELKLAKADGLSRAEQNLARTLRELDCGNIAIPIRRSRRTLFLSGPERTIIYCGTSTSLQDDGSLLDEQVDDPDPAAYSRVDYGAINPDIKPALNAFFAYLSGNKTAKPA